MKKFNYQSLEKLKLNQDLNHTLNAISKYQGRLGLFLKLKKPSKDFRQLTFRTKINSILTSNKIEGIYTTPQRLKTIINKKIILEKKDEKEIAGYHTVLNIINTNFQYINITPNYILQLHQILFSFTNAQGGVYKNSDNNIIERGPQGEEIIRFKPLASFLVTDKMIELCHNFNNNFYNPKINPLILIFTFVFDFLCIHPFNDGNGRLSRLLTLLLLQKADHSIVKYNSFEKIIEKTSKNYYSVLFKSSQGWHNDSNDVSPFIDYMLMVLKKCYQEIDDLIINNRSFNKTKMEQIKEIFHKTPQPLTKNEISELLPHISIITIEFYLKRLLDQNFIKKNGISKKTTYSKQ